MVWWCGCGVIVGMSVSFLRGRTVRRVLGVVVVAGLLGSGVTGCSDDAGAKTENTVDASPTPASTPTDANTDGDGDSAEELVEDTPAEPEQRPVPEEPEAMKTGDKAGAIAAAQYFVEVIEYSMHTSTTDLLEKYSYEKCGRCSHFIEVTNKRREDSINPSSVQISAKENGAPYFAGQGAVLWSVPMKLTITETWEDSDSPDIEKVETEVSVGFEDGHWTLVEIGNADQ